MEPIISPWLFYLVDLSNSLCAICIMLSIVFGILTTLSFIESDMDGECDSHRTRQYFIYFLITAGIAIITPSPDTVYKMIAASFLTPDNIQLGRDELLNLVKDLAQIIKTK